MIASIFLCVIDLQFNEIRKIGKTRVCFAKMHRVALCWPVRNRFCTRCTRYCSSRKLHCASGSRIRVLYGPKSVHYRPRRGVTGVPCVWTSVRVGSVKQFSCISVSCAGSPEKPTADGASLAGSVHSSGVDAGWTSADAAQTSVAEIAGSHGQGVGELASLGLGGYSPSGLIQSALELLHVHAHLPWWLSIITATVALRILMFPLAVRMTTNAAKIANLQPETAAIMKRANDYKMAGNMQKRTEELVKLSGLYQKHGCNPLMMFAMPMLQIPVFVSFFFALRKMAAAPVASMTHGGAFWFTDLTVADPFFALPLIACLTFLTNVEVRRCRARLCLCHV